MNQANPSGTSVLRPFLLIAAVAMVAMAPRPVSAELLHGKWLLC